MLTNRKTSIGKTNMNKYFHFSLILLFCNNFGHCMSKVRTSLSMKYDGNILQTTNISSWKIGGIIETSHIQCIARCMMADTCFWATFYSGTCELLSISRTEINSLLSVNNEGLPTYQMIRGCSKQARRFSDGCTFLEKDGYCLKYYGDGLTYHSARTVCRRDGGELLRIDNPNKQTTVERILNNEFRVNVPVTVQGTRKTSSSPWLFGDGTEMNYYNWNKHSEPSNEPPELYIYLNPEAKWKWNDVGLENKTFLCEIRA